jgi:hypothetical protein
MFPSSMVTDNGKNLAVQVRDTSLWEARRSGVYVGYKGGFDTHWMEAGGMTSVERQ